ncbi:hypothetical protein HO173_012395 [Letharia columbiana]|uniref:Uncharacterized protein n=1 Tax=Letharia columbiana TaxID=112416 RepID=A0A8H6CN88_9LECA|nr:uncharacterized protein HO173_012395 [Letharia columbiana]KAF6226649.1 hypothetical protein HO173_012395 [Letharia columbiana]
MYQFKTSEGHTTNLNPIIQELLAWAYIVLITGTADNTLPYCGKNAVPRCVELEHVFHCSYHPEVYCLDKEGKTCVLCEEGERRFEMNQLKAKRSVRDAQVAAALAARADTMATGKVRWDDKLPTVDKLAKTAAKKTQQALKTGNSQNMEYGIAEKIWKGPKGKSPAKVQHTEAIKADETFQAEQYKAKVKPKLRIQRGR